MILGRAMGQLGAARGPISTIQAHLRAMGMPVHASGALDQATVDGVNSVFNGWDDAPPKLRTGRLTAKDIAKQARLVAALMKKAAGGALVFHDVNE